jgi:nitroreductase
MDALDCILTRRSIRKYKDKPLPWELVVKVFDAGRLAPSSGNLQNWRFIIVREESIRKKIAEASLEQIWMETAPVHIVIIAMPEKAQRFYGVRGERLYTIQNCAAAAENMLLAAHALGLGACWVSAFDEDLMRSVLGLPEHAIPQAIITLGYADEQPEPPQKDRMFSKFFLDKWNAKKHVGPSGYGWWSVRTERFAKETGKRAKRLAKKISEKIAKEKK